MDEQMTRSAVLPAYVAVHLETTGTDPRKDGVVNIAIVRFEAGEPAERFTSIANPRCFVPRSVLHRCQLSTTQIANAPVIADLMPSVQRVVGNALIASDDCAVRAFLPALAERRWISVRSFIADAWPLVRDFRIEDIWEFLDLRHPAIDEIPIARGETEALMTGLILREALRALPANRTYVRFVRSDSSSPSRWN